MPQAKAKAATDTTSVAQGRFTVQLGAELKPMITALGDDIIGDISRLKGININLSMAEVVGGIIKAQHDVLLARRAEANQAKDGAGSESPADDDTKAADNG